MLSFFTTLLACTLAASSVSALSISSLAARGLYSPSLTSPDTNTIWSVGQDAVVSWDATKVPQTTGNFVSVDLYNTGSNGKDNLITSLSQNFDSATGSIGFTVPGSVTPGSYFVKIGSSASSKFEIAAAAVAYLPSVTGPDSNTAWKVGDKVDITWDISAAPANPAQLQYVDLYTESPSGGSFFVSRLATNVDVKPGSLSIVVPQVRTGRYFIMVGKYGHSSAHFSINA
ncbi:hypothetical protein PHLGIDRAFT_18441 [Phlebiopsis gigantea 11061_1 CR5-6]|uniref:Yeast cell wall synthesis Kre9/Knh1-like N-terminal domain-containing protein n=1 Tax=Phlebiopsis gigantea (strain 11061_1 CR5-6) TaxID=745531 RepID=A0A0C3S3E4_PHLG1|nr:hypothetical protein PHLGIDRAFT_18441 [Phlebiopsis gigantea 11061_1 CR5-6]